MILGADGLEDADAHLADLGRDGDPLFLDVGLVDRSGLDVVEHLTGPLGPELVQEGGLGGVGELLRRRLQNVLAHGAAFLWCRQQDSAALGFVTRRHEYLARVVRPSWFIPRHRSRAFPPWQP
ncbi:hypothetical protein [Actinopolymorpha pittospori]|uniref:Uncharacterized protein n=1 Tax=Actinopolymorpha pittospori TaxID=648752 RepID=A0A927RGD7_9ACTN|nr:hypothetical protein [Actinopolymorpha pittospori]MBE1604126.1 hypothetical protein [Actinopolymorpha pittospori]